jgi:hypothetical protein
MRFLLALAALPAALAHYNFEALVVNGVVTEPYKYVRSVKNSNSPVPDITSTQIVCNVGGLDADVRSKTQTYKVAPGDQIGFSINSNIGHPGPAAIYLSRAPTGTTAQDYLGDGDWFKVYETTAKAFTSAGIDWTTFPSSQGVNNFTFTLPANTPPGQYLMRGEHIALHGAGSAGGAQIYLGCAQLEVTGSGSGSPSPLVKFPGAYDATSTGMVINLYWPPPTSYTAPGPKTWPNACVDHTINLAGQATDGDCSALK